MEAHGMTGGFFDRLFPALVRGLVNARIFQSVYGFARSARAGLPVDASGAPLPWYTYPAIEFLSQLDVSGRRVFEYGAGNSSLFWRARGAQVACVENDPAWQARLAARDPALSIRLCERREDYVRAIEEAGGPFDLVAIDGEGRAACAQAAPARLAAGGLIVLDNSDRHPRAARTLREAGFFQADFSGFGPVSPYTWTTSLFLRADCSLQRGFRDPRPRGGLDQRDPDAG
jgi:hypothetical protein